MTGSSNKVLDDVWRAGAIVEQIKPLLANQPPALVGAALSELIAIFFATRATTHTALWPDDLSPARTIRSRCRPRNVIVSPELKPLREAMATACVTVLPRMEDGQPQIVEVWI